MSSVNGVDPNYNSAITTSILLLFLQCNLSGVLTSSNHVNAKTVFKMNSKLWKGRGGRDRFDRVFLWFARSNMQYEYQIYGCFSLREECPAKGLRTRMVKNNPGPRFAVEHEEWHFGWFLREGWMLFSLAMIPILWPSLILIFSCHAPSKKWVCTSSFDGNSS